MNQNAWTIREKQKQKQKQKLKQKEKQKQKGSCLGGAAGQAMQRLDVHHSTRAAVSSSVT